MTSKQRGSTNDNEIRCNSLFSIYTTTPFQPPLGLSNPLGNCLFGAAILWENRPLEQLPSGAATLRGNRPPGQFRSYPTGKPSSTTIAVPGSNPPPWETALLGNRPLG